MSHPGRSHRPVDMTGSESDATARTAAEFTALRPRLIGVAYGLLGTMSEAEDVVQEVWIRLQRTDRDTIEDLTGWLVTTTARAALDVLRSARVRREAYVGPWLPEPVAEGADPADAVSLVDSVSWAMLVVLETLSPAERAAFVLHDVFGLAFDEVARVVGREPAACRKLASRARVHLRERQPRFDVDPAVHAEVVTAFGRAAGAGDLAGLLAVLDPDAVFTSDGGGVVSAAPEPIRGSAPIADFVVRIALGQPGRRVVPRVVNRTPALFVFDADRLTTVLVFGIRDHRIATIDAIRNPAKLPGA